MEDFNSFERMDGCGIVIRTYLFYFFKVLFVETLKCWIVETHFTGSLGARIIWARVELSTSFKDVS